MNIQINYEHRGDMVSNLGLTELASLVLTHEECPENTEVSINFIDDDTIAELNETYRGILGPTDVLSFECDGYDDDFDDFDPNDHECFALGDIFIAVDVAERQTKEFGTTFPDEIYLLMTHGLLHLCGYDHIEDDEAEEMEALERELLTDWANTREGK